MEIGSDWIEQGVMLAAEPSLCLGLIALANDGTIEGDVHAFLPDDDIRVCTARVFTPLRNTLETLTALEERLVAATATLAPAARLDVIAFGCTSGAMAMGPARVHTAMNAGRPGVLVTDPISAVLRALERLACRRVAVLTPYIGEVNAMVARFLADHGLDLRATGFFPLVDDSGRARVDPASFEAAAAYLTADPAVEALLISCTALRTAPLIERLEAQIGRPVVTSNQALCWDALRLRGDNRSIPGAGQLFGV